VKLIVIDRVKVKMELVVNDKTILKSILMKRAITRWN